MIYYTNINTHKSHSKTKYFKQLKLVYKVIYSQQWKHYYIYSKKNSVHNLILTYKTIKIFLKNHSNQHHEKLTSIR